MIFRIEVRQNRKHGSYAAVHVQSAESGRWLFIGHTGTWYRAPRAIRAKAQGQSIASRYSIRHGDGAVQAFVV